MKKFTYVAMLAMVASLTAGCVEGAEGEELGIRASPITNTPVPPQTVVPLTQSYTDPIDPNETYFPASFVDELPDDNRVDLGNANSDFATFVDPSNLVIQKMRGRDYWMMLNLYSVNVHRGNHGLLLMDTAGHRGPGEFGALIGGLRAIGGWPDGDCLPLEVVM